MVWLTDAEIAEIPKRMSGQQYFFLRKLREHPHNLPLKYWPRATTWRRWCRDADFVRTVKTLLKSFEDQTQLLMAGAAQQAAMLIQATLTGGSVPNSGKGMCPHELELYHRPLKRLMGVMWLQIAKSNHHQNRDGMMKVLALLDKASGEGAMTNALIDQEVKDGPAPSSAG